MWKQHDSETVNAYNLALQVVLELVLTHEWSFRDYVTIGATGTSTPNISTIVHKFSAVRQKYGRKQFQKCHHCGRYNHKVEACHFKDAVCHSCNKKGHIKPIC
jgi:hypothetical protein